MPHLCKQEWKRPPSVRMQLSRTRAVLGRVISCRVGVRDESSKSCRVVLVQPLRIPSMIRRMRHMYVTIAS